MLRVSMKYWDDAACVQEALMEVQKDGCLSSKTIEMIARKCAHDRTV